jgi:hypothetical protein
MRVENIRTIYEVHPHQQVQIQYTTLIMKTIINIETHKVDLYSNKGKDEHWTNKHSIDKSV